MSAYRLHHDHNCTGAIGLIPEWTLQDRLRKARELGGYSQASLARAIGVDPSTVYRAESRGTGVRRPLVLAWALATGVDADWLLPRLDSNQQPADLWTRSRHAAVVAAA